MNRINELEKEIVYHQDKYYNGKPEISDAEFDKMWDELKNLDPNNSLFFVIGEDSSDGFPKAKHIIHMNSQEKVNTPEDYIDWHKRRIGNSTAIVQYKLDGISIELQYENGIFVKAITRGDGDIGDDISNNVRKMKGFVSTIKDLTFTGAIRGEILLKRSTFKKKYEPLGYKNPRNMASGLSKQKNGKGCEDLTIICYDAQDVEKNKFKTEIEKLSFLIQSSFEAVPTQYFYNYNKVIEYRDSVANIRDQIEYDIDGIVVKNIDLDYKDQERSRPEKQIAFKFKLEESITQIVDIEWRVSGKILTPVAVLYPVEIMGTTVKRASLHNPNRIEELNLHYGDSVVVSKRGEIIPQIERVYSNIAGGKLIPSHIKEFEFDGKKWKTKNEGTRLIIDDLKFPLIKYHRLEKWINKLDIKGFGDALLNDLYNKGFVKKISDFYTMNLKEYLKTTNLKKATNKAFNNLYSKKEISLAKFIAGFDIEGIGERVVEPIVESGFNTLEKLASAKTIDLIKVNGISEDRAIRIKDGIKELKEEMENAIKFLTIKKEEKDMANKTSLKGLTFCFTGALESMKRDDVFELVKSLGGSIDKNVTLSTNFLVTNTPNSGSSKNKKARSYGIRIISEPEFFKMIATRKGT